MKKFGGWLDEDENVIVGGTTLCECCTYCLKCQANPNRNLKKKQQETAQEDPEGEFANEEYAADKAGREGAEKTENEKKRSCCSICCRAIFCCGSTNTVSR